MKATWKCGCARIAGDRCVPCASAKKKALINRDREAFRVARRAKYASDPQYRERYRASNRANYHADPSKQYARKARRRALEAKAVGSHTHAEWTAILSAARGRCAICNQRCALQKDHIVPLAAGGTDYGFNLQAACGWCNNSKNCRLPTGQLTLFIGGK